MFKKRVSPVLQTESHECILACLTMIANYHGQPIKLTELRRQYPDFGRGGNLRDMIEVARAMELAPRAVKADMGSISGLSLPCIIHWNFSHFVVLEKIEAGHQIIVDPAIGRMRLDQSNFSQFYTGVALELSPLPAFHNYSSEINSNHSPNIFPIREYWRPVLQFIILSVIVLAFSILSPLVVQIVIDEVILKNDAELLLIIAGVFLVANLTGVLSTYLQGLHIIRKSASTRMALTHKFLDSLLAQPWAHFSRRNLGSLVAQYNSLNFLVSFVVQNVGSFITDFMFVVVVSFILLLIDSQIALIVMIFNVCIVGTRFAFLKYVRRLQDRQVADQANEEAYFVETMRGIGSVKANMIEFDRISGNLDSTVKAVNSSFSLSLFGLRYGFFTQCVKAIEVILVVYLLARLVMSGQMTIGIMYAFYAYRQFLEQRLTSLVDATGEILNLKVHRDRVEEAFENQQGVVGTLNVGNFMRFIGRVEFKNVAYKIDNRRKTIFENFSAIAESGKFVHIKGATGSGKTTLLRLLLNTLEPHSGEVLVDDIPISSGNISVLRNSLGVVMQEDLLFKGTILENITMFESMIDFQRAQFCAELCCIHKDIEKLPLRYQSDVGDMGSNLSTGQRQRLLLARALYRDPPILILDEATANLNKEVEQNILANLKGLNKTILFASHSDDVSKISDVQWIIGQECEIAA